MKHQNAQIIYIKQWKHSTKSSASIMFPTILKTTLFRVVYTTPWFLLGLSHHRKLWYVTAWKFLLYIWITHIKDRWFKIKQPPASRNKGSISVTQWECSFLPRHVPIFYKVTYSRFNMVFRIDWRCYWTSEQRQKTELEITMKWS